MTVTGNPAEFTVNGVAATVNSLTVPFSPTQDLHGYDHPWPGGGGKNKFQVTAATQTISGVTFIVNEDGTVLANGTATDYIGFVLGNATFLTEAQSGTYILNGCPSGGSSSTYNIDVAGADGYDSGNGVTLRYQPTISNTATRIRITPGTTVNNLVFKPMIRLATETDATFSPYSNICPISGRTGLSVYVSPTTAQADATTYSVDWTSEAGTVYGGTLDVVTGVLTVTMAIVDLGTLTWSKSDLKPERFYTPSTVSDIPYKFSNSCHMICSDYKYDGVGNTTIGSYYGQNGTFRYYYVSTVPTSTVREIYIVDEAKASLTASEFKSAMNGVKLVYELATPLTYQLTPQTINLLAGITNYVWSDTNEDITISFDVAAYIRHLFRVNGVDFSRFVERDSYATTLEPVYAETIQTMDGVNHTALLRTRGSIRLRFNPQTDSDTAALCSALLAAPCEVQYRCLQRDVDVTALMCVDTISAQFLSRCLYLGDEWNQIESITLTEL